MRWAFELRQKLLLTATPLQNNLLELYGLAWLIDDHLFGDKSAFQSRYANAGGDFAGLRDRLGQFCKRTLRKDCSYVNYTKRQAMTHTFAQTDEERSLHQDVLDFMSRDISFAFPHRQRQLIEMILFKTLASSPQAPGSVTAVQLRRITICRLPTHTSHQRSLKRMDRRRRIRRSTRRERSGMVRNRSIRKARIARDYRAILMLSDHCLGY